MGIRAKNASLIYGHGSWLHLYACRQSNALVMNGGSHPRVVIYKKSGVRYADFIV